MRTRDEVHRALTRLPGEDLVVAPAHAGVVGHPQTHLRLHVHALVDQNAGLLCGCLLLFPGVHFYYYSSFASRHTVLLLEGAYLLTTHTIYTKLSISLSKCGNIEVDTGNR